MIDEPLSHFTRRQIGRRAEDALRRADAVGVYPTPMQEVQRAVGVRERIDVAQMPDEVRAKKPPAWRRILGALWFQERTVFVDSNESEARQLFTDGHEATHAMCEWHEPTLKLDNEDTLFKHLHGRVEAEANYGASYFIFQGGRFYRRALREQVSIRTPLALASEYGASRHATLHYYVEEHPDAVALLVTGRFPYWDGTLPVWRSVESEAFRRRFGRAVDRLPGRQLSIVEGPAAPLADIVKESRISVDPPTKLVGVPDKDGTKHPFVAEAFFNGHCHFVVLVDKKARLLGRRLRLAG